jgi:hypothetical protein
MLFLKEYPIDINENKEAILVITGFIGSNDKHHNFGETGNYASLVANYQRGRITKFTHGME